MRALLGDPVLAVITALKADTSICNATFAGASPNQRVYRKKLPTTPTFPAITVSMVDEVTPSDTNTIGTVDMRIQCTAWSTTSGPEEALSKLIRKALHRKKNSLMTAGTTGRVYIIQMLDAGSRPDENTAIPLYMEHRDFLVMYDYKEV